VIEQALGHHTHAENLRRAVPEDGEVDAAFGLVPWSLRGAERWIPVYRSNWTLRAGLRARRLLRDMHRAAPLDALVIHTQVPAVLAIDWLRRVPTLVSLDATPIQYDALGAAYGHRAGPAWLERLKWRLNRAVFRRARHVVAWSEWARKGVIEGYGVAPERVSVIPPGVPTASWTRPARRGPTDAPVRVLFVGGDAERKGGLLLLEACRRLRTLLPLELDLVTRTRVAEEPGVRVHAAIRANSSELRALYHRADVFCLPTGGDCLPLVLAEAAASGLPLVATALAGIPEIVRHADTGLLVERGNLTSLVDALKRLALDSELRLSMGARAAELAVSEHDSATNARRLLEVVKRIAAVSAS
jgi:glycosyltransferase involved in cell wall biosynthesis